MLERIFEFSLRNRFLVLILTAFLVIGGIAALRDLPIDAVPATEDAVPMASADEDDDEDEYEDEEPSRLRRFSLRNLLQGVGACGFSMIVHVLALVVLGLMTFDTAVEAVSQLIVASAPQEEIEDPPVEIELQEEIEVVNEQTVSVFSAAPAVGIAGGGPVAAGSPTLDMTLVEKAETSEIHGKELAALFSGGATELFNDGGSPSESWI